MNSQIFKEQYLLTLQSAVENKRYGETEKNVRTFAYLDHYRQEITENEALNFKEFLQCDSKQNPVWPVALAWLVAILGVTFVAAALIEPARNEIVFAGLFISVATSVISYFAYKKSRRKKAAVLFNDNVFFYIANYFAASVECTQLRDAFLDAMEIEGLPESATARMLEILDEIERAPGDLGIPDKWISSVK